MKHDTINIFEELPVGLEINHITYQPWHRHRDAIEILFVLRGSVDITMSCSNYTLKKHEVGVINPTTFHDVKNSDGDSIVVSLFMDLNYFEKYFAYIKYIVFIMEPHGCNREQQQALKEIKRLIVKITTQMTRNRSEYVEDILKMSKKLLSNLTNHFNEVIYYNPNIKFNSIKIERYYLMKKYLDENFYKKTLLEDLSSKEFFSKSYLSHVFRDVSTFSLKEIICFTRNWKSEVLLLLTNKSINQISDECGYSDPKYYYRHFKKWYQCTPFAYRRKYKKEINETAVCSPVEQETVSEELKAFLDMPALREGEEKQYVLFYQLNEKDPFCNEREKINCDWKHISGMIDSYNRRGVEPLILMNYSKRSHMDWEMILKQCRGTYGQAVRDWEFWLTYDDFDLTDEIDRFLRKLETDLPEIRIKTMIVP